MNFLLNNLLNKIAFNVELSLQGTFVQCVIFSTMTTKQKKFSIVKVAVFAELVGEKTFSIVAHVVAVYQILK